MPEIFCEFHYDSAHRLPNVPVGHKCGRLHGHTYRLTVFVDRPIDPKTGWVVDFADIQEAVQPWVCFLDHHLINDVIENPTAELQAKWFWNNLKPRLPGLSRLRLQEGMSNTVNYP